MARDKVTAMTTPLDSLLLTRTITQLEGQAYPWKDPIEFFTSPRYLGAYLFPAQRLLLKLWNLQTDFTPDEQARLEKWTHPGLQGDEPYKSGIQGDVLERIAYLREQGHEWFPTVVAVMGRRAGKTFLTGLQLSYCTACFLFKNGWNALDGAALGHEPNLVVMATTAEQAQATIFTDFYRAVLANPFFAPYITRAIPSKVEFADLETRLRQEKMGMKLERDLISLRARAASSNSAGARGWAIPFYAFDEGFFALAGESARSGNEAIKALMPSLTQFYPHQMAIFPSSPRNRGGELYGLYEAGLSTRGGGNWSPDIFVCQMESWKMYE